MNASLANLAETLNGKYKYTNVVRHDDGKDIFQYSFRSPAEKFDTQIADIKHEDFYNILTKTNIMQDEYDNFKLNVNRWSLKP